MTLFLRGYRLTAVGFNEFSAFPITQSLGPLHMSPVDRAGLVDREARLTREDLRASSYMSLVDRAGSVAGIKIGFCYMRNFSPVSEMKKW